MVEALFNAPFAFNWDYTYWDPFLYLNNAVTFEYDDFTLAYKGHEHPLMEDVTRWSAFELSNIFDGKY